MRYNFVTDVGMIEELEAGKLFQIETEKGSVPVNVESEVVEPIRFVTTE